MAEYGGKPVPIPSGEPNPQVQQFNADLANMLSSFSMPDINFNGVTLDSVMQNTRNLMPQVLLDAIDGITTPAGPDLSVPQGPQGAGGQFNGHGATGSFGNNPDAKQPLGSIPTGNGVGQGGQGDPAIQMLTQGLIQEAQALDQQVTEKATRAEQTVQNLDNALQVRDHFANTKFNDELLSLVGPDRIVVQRLPKGTKNISRSPGVEVTTDPNTGEVLVTVPQEFMQQAPLVQQNDTKIAKAIVDTTPGALKVNVEDEFRKLQNMTGEALSQGISNLNIQINLEAAKHVKRIQDAAAMQSGLFEAQAAVQKNLQLDMQTGFTQRFNTTSAQTQAAQNRLASVQATSVNLANQLLKADPDIAKLEAIKQNLLKFEVKREGRESKAEDLRNTVTQEELVNYHFAFGNSGNDKVDRETIARRRDKDKVMGKIISSTKDNIWSRLADPSTDVRTKALKLVEEYDRAANGKGPDESIITAQMIKKYVDNPDLILKDAPITPKEKSEITKSLQQAGLGKEFSVRKDAIYGSLLAKIVQNRIAASYDNAAGWTLEPGPLKDIIQKVSKTHPKGEAPTKDVVFAFMFEKIPGPDGKNLPHVEREKILQRAFDLTVANEFKSYLINDPDAIRMAYGQKISNWVQSAAFAKALGGEVLDPANADNYNMFGIFGAGR